MGEAHALGRTNSISSASSSAADAGAMAMEFAPPADAKKGLPRLPVMGWREMSVEVEASRRPQPRTEHKGTHLETSNADFQMNETMDFYLCEESPVGSSYGGSPR